jgi:hypothetical protein
MPRLETIFDDFAVEAENILIKIAQSNNYDLALRMLNDLSKEQVHTAGITTQTDANGLTETNPGQQAQPVANDLKSLDAFVNYVYEKRFNYNGKQVVFPGGQTRPEDAKQNVANGLIEYKMVSDPTRSFWLDKEGLIVILKAMQTSASKAKNIVFSGLVENLINQVSTNKSFGVSAEDFKQEQETAPVNKDPQEQTQQQNEQNTQNTNVSDKTTQEVSNEHTEVSDMVMPFKLETSNIDISKISQFLDQLTSIISYTGSLVNPNTEIKHDPNNITQIKPGDGYDNALTQLGPQSKMLGSSIQNTKRLIADYVSFASPQAKDGINLPASFDIDAFVSTYTENRDERKASDMAIKLIPVCNSVSGILDSIRASTVLMRRISGNPGDAENMILKQQEQAIAFSHNLSNISSRLRASLSQKR